ncbi:glycoside hydrolase [Microthyrium microscopicum]|uniref:Glycoside hydrolase n=1 Tax=Microthyrium microscopicum TaxID=703497 RepID=A0A6A6UH78_9PEZI|nr:glycoside hydrolase [Microthyrium microscopicum]
MPRLVLYQQTHHVTTNGIEAPISLLPLYQQNTGVTHVIISALHVNGPGEITLNDHTPNNTRFDQMWSECRTLQEQGIKIMFLLGGAAPGTYQRLSANESAAFESFYSPVRALIEKHGINGIDLDVEEPMMQVHVQRLIRRLRQDFGPTFIITLAPVYPAMLPRRRAYLGISRRILNSASMPTPDPVMNSLCRANGVRTRRNLSGFDYLQLEATLGNEIDWYNVQVYCGWGDPSGPGMYETLVDAGWKSEKVVLGVVTNPSNGAGWISLPRLTTVVRGLKAKYGEAFGGVMGWEYFNAGMNEPRGGPWQWVKELGIALGRVEAPVRLPISQGRPTVPS